VQQGHGARGVGTALGDLVAHGDKRVGQLAEIRVKLPCSRSQSW
jgi:hypothetical protein